MTFLVKHSNPVPVPAGKPARRRRVADSPCHLLLPYQRNWLGGSSRFKFGLQARQTGKDFSTAAEGVRECLLRERAGRASTWMLAAPSERQSREALLKWREWAEAFRLALADRPVAGDFRGGQGARLRALLITFPWGSRIFCVPGRPDTVRGFSTNVVLTEGLFFMDFAATWRAILPSVTNPLRGGLKKVRLISTPNGQGNAGHQLWEENYHHQPAEWGCHFVDIHQAVAQGLSVDVAQLRKGINDPEGWAQEYELQFLDQSSVLLSYELIAGCENAAASETMPEEFWQETTRETRAQTLALGVDFGRKRDLTVCWALVALEGGLQLTREVLALENQSSVRQLEYLRPRIARARRVCFDYTGAGVGLGDCLAQEFGEYDPGRHRHGKIELCTFTNQFKSDLLSKLRMAFEQKILGVPASQVIREDLHSLQRVALPGGGMTYRAAHNTSGHADRANALALAVRAITATVATFNYAPVARPRHDLTVRRPAWSAGRGRRGGGL